MSSSRGARPVQHAGRALAGTHPVRSLCVIACACFTLALAPRVVGAVSNSKEEFAEAVHSKPSIDRGAELYRLVRVVMERQAAADPMDWCHVSGGNSPRFCKSSSRTTGTAAAGTRVWRPFPTSIIWSMPRLSRM